MCPCPIHAAIAILCAAPFVGFAFRWAYTKWRARYPKQVCERRHIHEH